MTHPTPPRVSGARGGRATRDAHGTAHLAAIAKSGGETTRDRHGLAHYARIGKKGGDANRAAHDDDHFRAIGRKGGARVRELIAKAREMEAGK